MKSIFYKISIICCFGLFAGCSDFLDAELKDGIVEFDEGLVTEADYQELLNGIYDVTVNSLNGSKQQFAILMGEDGFLEGNVGFLAQVYKRSTDFFNSDVGTYYGDAYLAVTRANTLIDNAAAANIPDAAKSRMIGEAKVLRAVSMYELVRLFAQPYGYTSDNTHLGIVVNVSSTPEARVRGTVAEAYTQILADLTDAESVLPEENGIFINKYSAKAYLAKVHLTMQDYATATDYAQEVINSGKYTLSSELNNRYLQDEVPQEALFYAVSTGLGDGKRSEKFRGILASDTQIPTIRASQEYLNLLRSDPDDARNVWVAEVTAGGSTFNVFTKFNLPYFNVSQITLTEMYLIAAEALALQNKDVDAAIGYINAIKNRAGVKNLDPGTAVNIVLAEARIEKRKEFGGEGINFFDLRRRGAAGENIFIRNAPWDCPGMALQFPASEITVKDFVLNEEGGCE